MTFQDTLNNSIKTKYSLKSKPGITEDVVRQISKEKNEPKWMLDKRLRALEIFNEKPIPDWGPDLSELNLEELIYYIRPEARESRSWEDLPEEIREQFEKLGIPEAEREYLGGVGGQMDSDVVYHNIRKELEDQGVIFENMDVAVQKYPEMVKEFFMTKCVPANDHKFAALHGAVWSGGTFIYVPRGVDVKQPLQAYFRMNETLGGQFEHTLIIVDEEASLHYIEGCSSPRYSQNSLHAGCVEIYVKKNAKCRYTSVENWSKNVYNLNTKRAIVEENGFMEWINSNIGAKVTMLYPSSILIGRGARTHNIGIAFAGDGQNIDTGSKVFHLAPNTSSLIISKSISKKGGITTYRGQVYVSPKAKNSKVSVNCDALLLDKDAKNDTIPKMDIKTNDAEVSHEASVGRISEDSLFYLMSRGLSEEEALNTIVNGFVEPIVRELPIEYAVEFNRLVELEMEGSIG